MQTKKQVEKFLRLLRYAHALFRWVIICFVLLVLANVYLVTVFRVDGKSMEPTLSDGKMVPVCLICTRFSSPQVGDIVIVQYDGEEKVRFVKRVVAVPGDQVVYGGQRVTLSGDQYFVVGDNRAHSTDSRTYGPITKSQIIGKLLGSYADSPSGY